MPPAKSKPHPDRSSLKRGQRQIDAADLSVEPEPKTYTVFQIGNFEPEHSTENHLRRALIENGHKVLFFQENDPQAFPAVTEQIDGADFVLWTRTGWDWASVFPHVRKGTSVEHAHALQRKMLRVASAAGKPVVGYHLDIWWGLAREHQITTEPFFEVDLLITADGGHDDRWAEEGINHVWFPPGVSRAECEFGTKRAEYTSRLAFVGSHDGGYHAESRHRRELVSWLRTNFRRDCAFWPQPGQHAVRGEDLQDLYASVDVVVGDSCFAGTGLSLYWSDRIPETIGRGGFLLHPDVIGLEDHFDLRNEIATWPAFEWTILSQEIEHWLSHPADRAEIRHAGRERVLKDHTYEARMRQLVALLTELGKLS